MVKAKFFSQNGKITGFSIKGHTNSAPKGYDIYCAGISAISQSAWLCITNYLHREIESEEANGTLILKLKEAPDDLTEAVFQTLLIGLKEIEKLVPKFVEVSFKKNDF